MLQGLMSKMYYLFAEIMKARREEKAYFCVNQ